MQSNSRPKVPAHEAEPLGESRLAVRGAYRLPVRLALAATALSLAACAAVQPNYIDSNDALATKSLAVRVGSTPSFYSDTPGRRFFGPFGAVSALQEGNRLIRAHGIEDPAHAISRELGASLAALNGMRLESDPDKADIVMDVKTTNWDFRPHRNDAAALYVVYAARVTLTDQATDEVLTMGRCRSSHDPQTDRASIDELLADDGQRLRSEIKDAARECVARLVAGPLRVALQPDVAPAARRQLVEPVAQHVVMPRQ